MIESNAAIPLNQSCCRPHRVNIRDCAGIYGYEQAAFENHVIRLTNYRPPRVAVERPKPSETQSTLNPVLMLLKGAM